MRYAVGFCALAAAVLVISGCSSGGVTGTDPREVVKKMFWAIEKDDRQALAHYLDFASLLGQSGSDYALQSDSARAFAGPEEIMDDLLKGGFTFERWSQYKKVVNKSGQLGDTAIVEVTFHGTVEGQGDYYNRFGLRKVNDVWKIFSFRVTDNSLLDRIELHGG